jgi:hypothetical protein
MRRRALLLLTTMALVLAVASGTAMGETKNGRIYFQAGGSGWINSIDPTASNPQPTLESEGDTFDISRDRKTLVYGKSYFGPGPVGPLFTFHLGDWPYGGGTEVQITNLWTCDPDCTDEDKHKMSWDRTMTQPRFSADGETIYFLGRYILASDDDSYGIYSVSTEGGEATKIPINLVDDNGTPVDIQSFALSHDGSKFALGGGPRGVFTVPVSGGGVTRVTTEACGGAAYPSFSPNDQMIVYNSFIRSGDDCTGTGHWTIFTTPVDNAGTSPGTPLFPEDATDTSTISKYWPSYSPDGKYITFSNWRDGTYKLATAPATGGSITNVANCAFCYPLWIEKLPDTTLTSTPSAISSPKVSFAFSSDESDATFECSLDGAEAQPCTSPQTYTDLSAGTHTFEVRALNSGGLADLTPAKYTWTVDNVPETTINSGPLEWPPNYVRSTSASFSFSSDPAEATFQCKRDTASSFTACSSPKSYSSLSQGSHTFWVRAINTAGKPDPYPASRTWFVDTVVPKGTVAINGKDVSTKSQTVRLYLSASDPSSTTSGPSTASGVASMRFRNENTTTWSDWFDYSGMLEWQLSNGAGTKTVYAQYKDRAGNVSATAYDKIKYAP